MEKDFKPIRIGTHFCESHFPPIDGVMPRVDIYPTDNPAWFVVFLPNIEAEVSNSIDHNDRKLVFTVGFKRAHLDRQDIWEMCRTNPGIKFIMKNETLRLKTNS